MTDYDEMNRALDILEKEERLHEITLNLRQLRLLPLPIRAYLIGTAVIESSCLCACENDHLHLYLIDLGEKDEKEILH